MFPITGSWHVILHWLCPAQACSSYTYSPHASRLTSHERETRSGCSSSMQQAARELPCASPPATASWYAQCEHKTSPSPQLHFTACLCIAGLHSQPQVMPDTDQQPGRCCSRLPNCFAIEAQQLVGCVKLVNTDAYGALVQGKINVALSSTVKMDAAFYESFMVNFTWKVQ